MRLNLAVLFSLYAALNSCTAELSAERAANHALDAKLAVQALPVTLTYCGSKQ